MIVYNIEIRKDGEWEYAGQGSFTDYEEAQQEAAPFLEAIGITDPADWRISRADEIDFSRMDPCEVEGCGGHILFDVKFWRCDRCGAIYE